MRKAVHFIPFYTRATLTYIKMTLVQMDLCVSFRLTYETDQCLPIVLFLPKCQNQALSNLENADMTENEIK